MFTKFHRTQPTPEQQELILDTLAVLNQTPEFIDRVNNVLRDNPLDKFVVTCVSPADGQLLISCFSGIDDEEEAAVAALAGSGFQGSPEGTFIFALATGTCQRPNCRCGKRSTYMLPVIATRE